MCYLKALAPRVTRKLLSTSIIYKMIQLRHLLELAVTPVCVGYGKTDQIY